MAEGLFDAKVRGQNACELSLQGVGSDDALVPWHRDVK
jgi:hypothetical protein